MHDKRGSATSHHVRCPALRGFIATACIIAGMVGTGAAQERVTDPLRLVDPRIGTAHDGQTYPVVGMPFGMTGWTPETRSTEAKCIAPYYYNDARITGFRGSHWLSGSCTQDYGSVTIMPTAGELKVDPDQRASRFQHASEIMSPAYYSVHLDDSNVTVELTGTTRAGMMRISFPPGGPRNLIIEPNVHPGQGFIEVRPGVHEVVGFNPVVRMYQGEGKPAGFSGYFVMRLQDPMVEFGTWCDGVISKASQQHGAGCQRLGAYVKLQPGASATRPVVVRIGTSFTSLAEAERNLSTEEPGWDFDVVRARAEAAWRHHLARIEVQGGTSAEQTTFYTALFHASLAPRIVSDADGTYNGFANDGHLRHTARGTDYYDDFSLWDTFRALHPLLTILDPHRDGEMMQSLVLKGEQRGFLPIFPTWNSYTSEMIGDHSVAVMYDAYAKGIRNFDIREAYRLVRQNAFITPPHDQYVDGKGRRALTSYEKYGYIPLEDQVQDAYHPREQVSRTLEYAYDDYVAAQFAAALGHKDDAAILFQRSASWRNVFDPETRFVRGRHADGSWITPFDPAMAATYVTEANPWQYTFFVPHNVEGLMEAAGGSSALIAKLDGLFDAGLYDQGNEPSHGIAYLYNFAGSPEKTQERVRGLLKTQFGPRPDGLPGNDDAGQMSAWYVLSAMGFFPECPGKLDYSIGSPLFTRIVIHLSNGRRFTIAAPSNSVERIYVRSVQLDGHPHPGWTFTHRDIVRGSKLSLEMIAARPSPQEKE
ncbi:alpha-1,2-mannosidase, putative [Bryocella elongata]|uniref:Alpha-1,2-mannosidase, putative n=1 Tax=Bryocella elongata TaxID=863522 RepID=A0A1H5ZIT3_9BACT|nr:GH92 family glycosyl hydrolase [Bryocella elongata]SEG36443.1 alpha-1,2-mannosidase, putative [Bryocella elongata]